MSIRPDVPANVYHADELADTPTLSSSVANILLASTPAHAWAKHPRLNPNFERKSEEKFELGTAVHSLLLEGESSVEVFDYPNWKTKESQEARDLARAHGRIPMLGPQWDDCQAMVAAVQARLPQLEVDPPPLTNGKPEQTIVWEDQGVLCRARLDWLHDDMSAIDDVKSTGRSASPHAFSKALYGMGYHVQARFYQRGIMAITGREPEFRFLVAETSAPFALSVTSLSPAGVALADQQIDAVLETWKRCLDTDEWPSYPTRVCYAEPPGWIESAWLEKEVMEEAA